MQIKYSTCLAFLLSLSLIFSQDLLIFHKLNFDFYHLFNFIGIFIVLSFIINQAFTYYLKLNFTKQTVNNNVFTISFITIFLCYLPYYFAYFPTNFAYEGNTYFRNISATALPALYIAIAKLYIFLHNHFAINFKHLIALHIFLQMMIGSLIFSYSVEFLNKLQINKKILIILTLIYALFPLFPMFAITYNKDFIANILLFFVMINFTKYFYFSINKQEIVLTFIALILTISTEKTYFYLFLLIALFSWKNRKFLIFICAALILNVLLETALIKGLDLKQDKNFLRKNYLSTPIVQLYRSFENNQTSFREKEIEEIKQLYNLQHIEKRKPGYYIADQIRNSVYYFEKTEYIKRFLKIYVRHLSVNFKIYVETFLQLNFPLLFVNNVYDFTEGYRFIWENATIERLANLGFDEKIESNFFRENTNQVFERKNIKNSIFSFLFVPSTYFYGLIFLFFASRLNQNKTTNIFYIVLGFKCLLLMISPVILIRYSLILFFVSPFLFVFSVLQSLILLKQNNP